MTENNNILKHFDSFILFYRSVCKELKWKEDSKLWSEMTAENETELKVLEEKIKDAEENLGESEHREALLAKAEYLTKIGIDFKSLIVFLTMIQSFDHEWAII